MNTLTWFLYLAHIIEGIRTVSAFAIILGILGAGVTALLLVSSPEDAELSLPRIWAWLKGSVAIVAVSATILVFVPDKPTLYLMATSELGQMVVSQQITQDMAKELYSALLSGLSGK